MIKFEKIQTGMKLLDIHRVRAGNTTMTRLGKWTVDIISVDAKKRTALVSWNGNKPVVWYENQLRKLYAKEPPSYARRRGLL